MLSRKTRLSVPISQKVTWNKKNRFLYRQLTFDCCWLLPRKEGSKLLNGGFHTSMVLKAGSKFKPCDLVLKIKVAVEEQCWGHVQCNDVRCGFSFLKCERSVYGADNINMQISAYSISYHSKTRFKAWLLRSIYLKRSAFCICFSYYKPLLRSIPANATLFTSLPTRHFLKLSFGGEKSWKKTIKNPTFHLALKIRQSFSQTSQI